MKFLNLNDDNSDILVCDEERHVAWQERFKDDLKEQYPYIDELPLGKTQLKNFYYLYTIKHPDALIRNNPDCMTNLFSYYIVNKPKFEGTADQYLVENGIFPFGFGNPLGIKVPEWVAPLLGLLFFGYLLFKVNED